VLPGVALVSPRTLPAEVVVLALIAWMGIFVLALLGAEEPGEVEVEQVHDHAVGAEYPESEDDQGHPATAQTLADERVARNLEYGSSDEQGCCAELRRPKVFEVHAEL
jgi:hypothetical protein